MLKFTLAYYILSCRERNKNEKCQFIEQNTYFQKDDLHTTSSEGQIHDLSVLACKFSILDNVILSREILSFKVPVQHVLNTGSISQLHRTKLSLKFAVLQIDNRKQRPYLIERTIKLKTVRQQCTRVNTLSNLCPIPTESCDPECVHLWHTGRKGLIKEIKPEHQWQCQRYEVSQPGLACNAKDGPSELVEGSIHLHCNLKVANLS